ncbi:aquaporin [Stereum hirsutum FP-91666 SS1]|uniref:aquaporin n=1 Tax=Stereum hirsutum (strain FP-91666) TaxID=721885 RepID=UPI0004449672|nr:aquaporin [Stereum hirsutum FP-91666 SS1]EIM85991.1 aquaporin [Stereum hirsutum FP-91666 SS1]
MIREYAAEMLGTMVLVLFGNGVNCQVVLGSNTNVSATEKGDYTSLCLGWACGGGLGVWICGGISGGHINPAVTLTLATFRNFPWKKVPGYIFAQFLGAWIGAMLVFANYFHAIDVSTGRTTPGTASLFGTYALDYLPAAGCFFDEFLGAFILVLVILAVTDKRNGPPPAGMVPLVIFIVFLGISAAFGMQTGFAINPARDFGPRVMTAMMGYGRSVFTFRDQYWLWCPVIAPICGGMVAAFVYDSLLFLGSESILNRPNAEARRLHVHAAHAQKSTPHAGLGLARDRDEADIV